MSLHETRTATVTHLLESTDQIDGKSAGELLDLVYQELH